MKKNKQKKDYSKYKRQTLLTPIVAISSIGLIIFIGSLDFNFSDYPILDILFTLFVSIIVLINFTAMIYTVIKSLKMGIKHNKVLPYIVLSLNALLITFLFIVDLPQSILEELIYTFEDYFTYY